MSGYTLWVQGNDYINQNATLNVPDGLSNDGTILLESITNGYTETLALARHFHQRRRRHHPGHRQHRRRADHQRARWSTRGRSASMSNSY